MLSFLFLQLHYKSTKALQVPGISQKRNVKSIITPEKRVPPFIPSSIISEHRKHVLASLTLEAALSLPLFLFFAIALMQPMNWLDRQRKVQTAVEAVCEEMSLTAYLIEIYNKNPDEQSDDNLYKIVSDVAAGLLLKGKAEEYADGIVVIKSDLEDERGNICMEIQYREKIPFFSVLAGGVTMRAGAQRRPWTGLGGKIKGPSGMDGRDQGGEEMVYVGANMGRYHLYRDCHYLSNQYETLSAGQIGTAKNASGRRYTACSRCVKGDLQAGQVYVTPEGEHYHADKSCSAMVSYVRCVPKKEVEYLGLCSYCARKGG